MIKKYALNFANILVFDNFLVAEMHEGVNFDSAVNKIFLDICSIHFPDKPFGYISNRVNSYSVDPTVYMQTANMKNLAAIAVVADDEIRKLNVKVEKLFFERDFEYFDDIEKAKRWVNEIVKNRKARLSQS